MNKSQLDKSNVPTENKRTAGKQYENQSVKNTLQQKEANNNGELYNKASNIFCLYI